MELAPDAYTRNTLERILISTFVGNVLDARASKSAELSSKSCVLICC